MSTVFDGSVVVPAYERGSFAPILVAVSTTVTPAPPAMPTQGTCYGIAPSTANNIQPDEFLVSIDTTSTGVTVKLYGSLDGINFYQIGLIAGYTAAGLYPITAFLNVAGTFVGAGKLRYITAALTANTGGGPVSVGFVS